MKKIIAMLLVLATVFAFAACTPADPTEPSTPDNKAMTYAEFMAAAVDTKCVVEFYVQATQGWWNDSIVIYGQTEEGGYFCYGTVCTEEQSKQLVPGTKVRVTGPKKIFDGEVEIAEGQLEILGGDTWIADSMDVTALLGTDELEQHMNKKVCFKGLTFEGLEYKNGEPGDDIYVTVGYNGASYDFCVEVYLTGPETDVYKAFETLQVGDVVDVEGFLYWYKGANPHITSIKPAA